MTAKEYLEQISYLKTMLSLKLDDLKEQQETIKGITGAQIKERVQTSATNSSMDNIIIKLNEIGKEIEWAIEEILKKKEEITAIINQLDNLKHREVLYRRYSLNQDWETIANKMNYEVRYVQRMNGLALQEINKIIKKDI